MSVVRTPRFLIANLGSEVSRLLDWKEKGDRENAEKCLVRAHVILKQLSSAPEMKARGAELSLLEDVIDDTVRESPKYEIRGDALKEYFYPFASRAFL
ncbi:MAG: hypothetical protein A2664_03700 [Candidatus Taylorbacteria bacterium RIFCSPHIGHO2_01_FULL_46_22b]|uniref:Uncharacterized protein n=1 Tax=Candidatus Taylorbacteria bacterium RIFCSPHIGHO2_01_FULL_46_22b TaxID=1802301 RepID=A0A1G2M1D6_9BACT|nr:MAG: hypothetical protein A2664_03700 [Candidatus Taylorbacteria bacterium RIFCSPHIGHO2_01_FULL_46_22b]